jgi:hypothetical protein
MRSAVDVPGRAAPDYPKSGELRIFFLHSKDAARRIRFEMAFTEFSESDCEQRMQGLQTNFQGWWWWPTAGRAGGSSLA